MTEQETDLPEDTGELEGNEIEGGQEAAETPPVPDPEREALEAEARKYGWRPKEDFDLEPSGWVDADRFLEMPSTVVKMMRDENREAQKAHKAEMERLAEENRKTLAKALRVQAEEKKAQYEARVAELTRQQRQAVEIGDIETYDRIEAAKRHAKPPEEFKEVEAPRVDPTVQEYREANEWTKDPVLWDFAVKAVEATPDIWKLPADKQLEFAEQKVKDLFPHKFARPDPPAPRPSRVDGGGLGGSARKPGVNSLPREALAAGKEFVEMGIFKSIDEYAKAYHAGEA